LRETALSNQQPFHIVAWVERCKTPIMGVNGQSSRPEFRRKFKDGKECFTSHAEMEAVFKLKEVRPNDVLHVMRFTKNGGISMAKPCQYCQEYLKKKGIRRVKYTDWDGSWKKMTIE
jgi:deoxycytidylate deaminase